MSVSVPPLSADVRNRLLRRIGATEGEPTPEYLEALQRSFLTAIPYEDLEIQLGRPTTIDPEESAARILTGRGGYCYHLNGTFGALLASLGFEVSFVVGNPDIGDPEGWGRHVVILVACEGGTYVADVGLGDGFRDPLPLREGPSRQDPFAYRLERISDVVWRYHHDELGTIDGFDFDVRPVPLASFEDKHHVQSTSPDSSFVRLLTVQKRSLDHALILRGCVLTRLDANGKHSRDIDSEAEWRGLLTGEYGLALDDEDLDMLWKRTRAAHEEWRASAPFS